MPSESPLQVIIYASPEHEHSAVRQAIASFDLSTDWGLSANHTEPAIHLGETYGTLKAPLGTSDGLADRLRTDAPGTTFLLWQDPHFEEADGHYVAYAAGVGSFEATCNASGAPHIALPGLVASLDEAATLTMAQWLTGPGEAILGTSVRKIISDYARTLTKA
ncbi:hypothetical protein [Streptomyces sp. NPDC056304]|uniref:hypothetical protein n=1 Tax=Streptomyces sp. NPDC056304 TaxID=3345778 RepID=UPI0035DAA5A1